MLAFFVKTYEFWNGLFTILFVAVLQYPLFMGVWL